MENLSFELKALVAHLFFAVIVISMVYYFDVVEKEQRKAQAWVCLLVPFVGPLFIGFFTIHEVRSFPKHKRGVGNNPALNDGKAVEFGISQGLHESTSDSSSGAD